MKNTKWMGTLAIAAAGALVGALCVVRGMPAQAAPAAKIVVAAVDIDVGQRLAPRFIKLVDSPTGKTPVGAFSDPHKLDGRVLAESMERGAADRTAASACSLTSPYSRSSSLVHGGSGGGLRMM